MRRFSTIISLLLFATVAFIHLQENHATERLRPELQSTESLTQPDASDAQFLDSKDTTGKRKRKISTDKEPAKIIRVVDGDTVKISLRNRNERVRLIGIDTPESRDNGKAGFDATRRHSDVNNILELGAEAANFVRKLLPPGTMVQVEFDATLRDKYDRLLVYLYLPNGQMLNLKIIESGYAYPMTKPPNTRYAAKFQAAFKDAVHFRRGLWSHAQPFAASSKRR